MRTAIIVCTMAAASAEDGTAAGTLTVDGKATKLAYAYAMAEPDPFDRTKEAVRITLSDVPLTPDALGDPFALQKMTQAGKLHAIVALVQQPKTIATTILYDAGFKWDSVSVAGTNNIFDPRRFDMTTVSGKLYTAKPDTFGPKDVTYEFSATFSAPIQRQSASAVTALAPRADDPIVKAAMAYLKAARVGDAAALKQAVVPDAAKDLDGAHGKEIVDMLRAMASPAGTVTGVETSGDTATVTVESKEGDTATIDRIKLVKIGGLWKVSPRG